MPAVIVIILFLSYLCGGEGFLLTTLGLSKFLNHLYGEEAGMRCVVTTDIFLGAVVDNDNYLTKTKN